MRIRRSTPAMPWIDKLMVSIARRRKRPEPHVRLKQRLGLNRGKAIGLPKRYPSQWLENRVRDRSEARWRKSLLRMIETGELPF